MGCGPHLAVFRYFWSGLRGHIECWGLKPGLMMYKASTKAAVLSIFSVSFQCIEMFSCFMFQYFNIFMFHVLTLGIFFRDTVSYIFKYVSCFNMISMFSCFRATCYLLYHNHSLKSMKIPSFTTHGKFF